MNKEYPKEVEREVEAGVNNVLRIQEGIDRSEEAYKRVEREMRKKWVE